jgi:hypothetical protein
MTQSDTKRPQFAAPTDTPTDTPFRRVREREGGGLFPILCPLFRFLSKRLTRHLSDTPPAAVLCGLVDPDFIEEDPWPIL